MTMRAREGSTAARWIARTTCLLAVAVALASGCSHPAPVPPPPAVTVARPQVEPVTDYAEFTGNTAASDSVTLVARVEGYLEGIHYSDGAYVKKGDLLFTIQKAQYEAQLQQAQAQVEAQKAALWHAKTELVRYQNLVKEESAPQTEVDRWTYERDSAAAGVAGAEAQVVLAKLNLDYTRVEAPCDGRVGRHLVDPGNLVGALGQQTSLAEIDRIDPLYVYFTIDERELIRLRQKFPKGTVSQNSIPIAFGLLEEDGYPHEGTLNFASLSVAPTTGTLQLRGTFSNPPPGILPGLFARVRVPTGLPKESILIPAQALGFDQQGEYVLVVNDANVVERRMIKTGPQQGSVVVVDEGVQANDRVVVDGLQRAVPGRTVTPEEAKAAPGPTASPMPDHPEA